MCIAILKPADTAPDWTAYENGHYDNPHSWGFAVVYGGQIVTDFGLGTFAEFRAAFEPYSQCKAIIHFRWATHGSKTIANCHPFMASPDLAMIHNGIISIKCNVHSDRSDTWHFNELVLKPLYHRDPEFYARPEIVYTQELAHRGNKFCFLHADGGHGIWGEDDGIWETDGHWYSNSGYRTSRMAGYYTSQSRSTSVTVGTSCDSDVMTKREVQMDLAADFSDSLRYADEPRTEEEEDNFDYEAQYINMAAEELMSAGFSSSTLKEVHDILGPYGIELLHENL